MRCPARISAAQGGVLTSLAFSCELDRRLALRYVFVGCSDCVTCPEAALLEGGGENKVRASDWGRGKFGVSEVWLQKSWDQGSKKYPQGVLTALVDGK